MCSSNTKSHHSASYLYLGASRFLHCTISGAPNVIWVLSNFCAQHFFNMAIDFEAASESVETKGLKLVLKWIPTLQTYK